MWRLSFDIETIKKINNMDLSYREYFASPSIFIENILAYNTALDACLEAEEEARLIDEAEFSLLLHLVYNQSYSKLLKNSII